MRDHPIFLIEAPDGESQPCTIVRSMFSQPDRSILSSPSVISFSRTLRGDSSALGFPSSGRSGRRSDVIPGAPSHELDFSTTSDLDRLAGDFEARLPFRPVLLTQRFDDIQVALVRQQIELEAEFQPTIEATMEQLEAMAAGLSAVRRRSDADDRTEALALLFCEHLSLRQESAEAEHEYQEAFDLEGQLRDGNARLVERLNVDEAAEFPDLVRRLQDAIDAAQEKFRRLQSRGNQYDMHSHFLRRDYATTGSRTDLQWRSASMAQTAPFAAADEESNETIEGSIDPPGAVQQASSLSDIIGTV
jgi:hypothetical protein